MAFTIPWNLIAMGLSGDIGGFTAYTDRFGRKTVFPKAPPEKPATARQVHARQRFADAVAAWKALSDSQKFDLEDICRKANASLTGQNLYIHTALMADESAIKTLENQTGITLFEIPFIP